MGKPLVALIVAMDQNRGIGKDGIIPWRLPEDMKRFREITSGVRKAVIMGRKTWESIPEGFRPLPDRRNVVISRTVSFDPVGAEKVSGLDEAIGILNDSCDYIFIIGGGSIYREALSDSKLLDALFITRINQGYSCDVTFPDIDVSQWEYRQSRILNPSFQAFTYWRNPEQQFVDPYNTASEVYRLRLMLINKRQFCPFCPGQEDREDLKVIAREGKWVVAPNQYSYKNAKHAFIFVGDEHVTNVNQLGSRDWLAIGKLIGVVRAEHGIAGGTFAMRGGDTRYTGATVLHLHGHYIVPYIDLETQHASPQVDFPCG